MTKIEFEFPDGKTEQHVLPASWEELNGRQLLYWSHLSLQKIDLLEAKKLFLWQFCRFSNETKKYIKERHLVDIAHTLTFLNRPPQMAKWAISSFWCSFRRYYGPGDALSCMTIAEFRLTENSYSRYLKSQDEYFLMILAATMYRPKSRQYTNDDLREPLNKRGTDRRAKRFKRLSPAMLQAILLNYEGCRSFIHRKYAAVFQTSQPKKSTQNLQDLQEVMEAVAGDKLGTIAQAEQTNIHRFFRHLVNTIEASKELQKS